MNEVKQSKIENLVWTQEKKHLYKPGYKENKNFNWALIKEQILPFRQIPDICSIQVKTTDQDPLFELFGIKKSRRKAKLEIVPWNNKKYNRYLVFRLRYMKGLKDKAYWDQVSQISRTSNVFWITALRSIMPDWHRRYNYWYVKRQIKKAKKLANGDLKAMISARIYIPKPNGKSRPLGVPEMSWRLYLNMINNFLVLRLKDRVNVDQHGFIPGRGTMTAWKKILEDVVKSKDIYEIDLKNAFNNISTKHIARTLSKHGLPKNLIMQLLMCSLSPTIFPYGEYEWEKAQSYNITWKEGDYENSRWFLLWESIIALAEKVGVTRKDILRLVVKGAANFWVGKKKYFKDLEEKRLDKIDLWYDEDMEDLKNADYFLYNESKSDPNEKVKYYSKEIFKSYPKKQLKDQLKCEILRGIREYGRSFSGVAQGSPISPFIFALCVNDFFFKDIAKGKIKCVAYADDAIFYGDISSEKEILKSSPTKGLEINLEKSGWIKREGAWCKTLKFLGMSYNEQDGRVSWHSSTRSGRTLHFDKELLLDLVRYRKIRSENNLRTPSDLNEDLENNQRITDLVGEIEENEELIKELESQGYEDVELKETGTGYKSRELELTLLGLIRQKNKQDIEKKNELIQWDQLNRLDLSTKLSTTGLMGFIQSRMYIGTWTYDITQDFKMSYIEGSWIDIQKKKGLKCNIFNASTFGYADLLKSLSGRQAQNLPREYKQREKEPIRMGNFFRVGPRLERVKVYRVRLSK